MPAGSFEVGTSSNISRSNCSIFCAYTNNRSPSDVRIIDFPSLSNKRQCSSSSSCFICVVTVDCAYPSKFAAEEKLFVSVIMLKIGVVFGQRSVLCWDIPVIESLKLFKDMYHIPEKTYKENMEIFSDILNLSEYIDKPPRLLSLGQRMRADLAAALLHNPEILFLDEPTIGIDVLAKAKIRDFIREMNQERNTTIILTTHDISDIEALCSKMMIIDKGTLLYNGTLQELKNAERYQDTAMENNLETIIKNIYEGDIL